MGLQHQAAQNVGVDPAGGVPLRLGDRRNNIRTLFVQNFDTGGRDLLVVLGPYTGQSQQGVDCWRLRPGQWKRLSKEETSRRGFAAGLWCFNEFTLVSLGVAAVTACDYDYTTWDSEEVLRRDRGSVD
jgi:hypothetical protein